MESIEELEEELSALTDPASRDRLLAKGLARGMIWKEGILPPDSPQFSADLTNDLLNHGYTLLGRALRLRTLNRDSELLDRSFENAAEAIEAAVRNGETDGDRGFHLTVAAASYHIGHYAARSFSLLAENSDDLNLSGAERILVALMQRQLNELASVCRSWLTDERNQDAGVARMLDDDATNFYAADASRTAMQRGFYRAIATAEFGLRTGDASQITTALEILYVCIEASEIARHVPLWWCSTLAWHLIDDLWRRSLHSRLPTSPDGNWDLLRRNFIDVLTDRDLAEIDLWPSQLAAADRVLGDSDNLVVALPTSSGKTRIAELCILRCLSKQRRVIYVTPLRALSAQIEATLSRTFRPLGFSITSVYGASGIGASDIETIMSADIVVATPEKLDFAIRQSREVIDDVGLIVLDEGHMIGLNEREIRYEILVQRLLRWADADTRRIVCLSAIFTPGAAFDSFTSWIRRDQEGEALRSAWRPTRQRPATLVWQTNVARLEYEVNGEHVFVPRFIESEPGRAPRRNRFPHDKPELLSAAIQRFAEDGHSVLVYCPMRASVESFAKSILKAIQKGYVRSFLPQNAREEIETARRVGAEWLGENHVAILALQAGIAVHHGQLPRAFLSEIERLLKRRVLHVAISSPTLAQGVDLSFGVLIFHSLWRNRALIPPKEFANVAGRVGRAYVDIDGIYVLPVHEADARKRQLRVSEFHALVRDARHRELESGLYQLISLCLTLLAHHLDIEQDELQEYVLNQQEQIDDLAGGEAEIAEQLSVVLAELDAGLLALIEDHECEVTEIAQQLDAALASSYWRRRIEVIGQTEMAGQLALLQARSTHIWNKTSGAQRRSFFSATVGTDTGTFIVSEADALKELLWNAANAVDENNAESLGQACADLASHLFAIYPFQPSSIPNSWTEDDWRPLIGVWMSGHPLGEIGSPEAIAFVQEGIVYKFVWAIEAVRIILVGTGVIGADENERLSYVGLCATYGVSCVTAAKLLEAGLESRTFACRLVRELGLELNSLPAVRDWLGATGDEPPVVCSESEQYAWQRFVATNSNSYGFWGRHREVLDCEFEIEPEIGERVRIITEEGGEGIVYSYDFEELGRIQSPFDEGTTRIALVNGDTQLVVNHFGLVPIPRWLQELDD